MIEQKDVDFLYETFLDFIVEDKQNLLKTFSERFQLAVTMEVTLTNCKPELYNRVHTKTLKLSELWYCFELLTTATEYGFGNLKEKSEEERNMEWLKTQRVSVMGKIEAEKPKKQNPFVNVDSTYTPFGKARLLNEKYFHDKWFFFAYESMLWAFTLTHVQSDKLSRDTMTISLSRYLENLTKQAQGEQIHFLTRGYNSLMGNSSDRTDSSYILSFIYALRCCYVHQGELPDSYQIPIEYKEFIVDECIKFLTGYCSLAYSTVIDELYLS
ncbi:hypothetical protein HA48_15590 [Pantoea wallisii]|uniref:Uncharacterized protein n=1 Tax=Pantoea wallisii TaxID=1076551 RepID=A0A1X1D473_9GAMM|nr:hypothetical protein [Pantoea wallisii]ORM71485.1 hypothetical protein HA48_15590 [Pantoea wallisii]